MGHSGHADNLAALAERNPEAGALALVLELHGREMANNAALWRSLYESAQDRVEKLERQIQYMQPWFDWAMEYRQMQRALLGLDAPEH